MNDIIDSVVRVLGLSAVAYVIFCLFTKRNVKPAGPYKAIWTIDESIVFPVGTYLLSSYVAGTLLVLFFAARQVANTQSAIQGSTMANFAYICMFEAISLALLYIFLKRRGVSRSSLGLVRPRAQDILYALSGFGLYFVAYGLVYVVGKAVVPWINFEQQQQLGFSTDVGIPALLVVFFSLVILAPIVEEIICRGFMYSGLRAKLSYVPAAVITSLLFAAAHLQPGGGKPLLWVAAIDTFILSMVLVFLRDRTKSLSAPIMLHMMKNGIAFYFLFVMPRLVF